jgi:uncharacterized protein YkwD/LysM repeat protein
MIKTIKTFSIILIVLSVLIFPIKTGAKSTALHPSFSTANELVSAVNAQRASSGFPAYQANTILMSIAQQQAEYELSIGVQTDISSDGSRPYQRALAAGYLVAGDISGGSVGYLAELLYGGVNVGAQEAVEWWYGDPGHEPYLMSSIFRDIGAGVAQSNNTFYYVVVVALSTGGTPVAYTPPAPLHPSTPSIIQNTPNPDGSITHIVQPGDTLGSIYLAYKVPLADILKLNGLTLNSTIYPNQKIIIKVAFTPTPTLPTSTPAPPPTTTPWPTSTSTPTASLLPPTPTPSPGLPVSKASGAVAIIIVAAFFLAGLIALLGRNRK